MQNQPQLAKFMVQTARYLIGDQEGTSAILVINYQTNSFRLEGDNVNNFLKHKAAEIAQTLLSHKHQVNFAWKFNK